MKSLIKVILLNLLSLTLQANAVVVQGESSPGVYVNVQVDSTGHLLQSSSTASPAFVITQTAVTITTTSGQLIAANTTRKFLAWMNTGANDVTCVPGNTTAVAGTGFIYQAGSGAGKQGATQTYTGTVPTNAFQCITGSSTSVVIVFEGN